MPINYELERQAVESSRIRHSRGPGPCYIPGFEEMMKAMVKARQEILADPVKKRVWLEQMIKDGRELGIPEEEIPTIDELMERW